MDMSLQNQPHSGQPETAVRLPRPAGIRGPLTRKRLYRTIALTAAYTLIAVLPSMIDAPVWLRAAALGLVPGAGIAYTAPHGGLGVTLHLIGAVILLGGSVAAALFLITQRGDYYLRLPAIPLFSATLSGWMATAHSGHAGTQEWVAYVAVALVVAAVLWLILREVPKARAARRVGDERENYLTSVTTTESQSGSEPTPTTQLLATPSTPGAPPDQAMLDDEEDGKRLFDYILALALQPRDKWEGFERPRNRFLLKAERYQLYALLQALAHAQSIHTPAYSGAHLAAGRELVARYTDRMIWAYWRLENIWGMARFSPNPIKTRKNIMFSGYLLLDVAMHAKAFGDDRFDAAESLTFRWNEHTAFPFSLGEIAEQVARNFQHDPMCLWDCEPGLTFPHCNAIALAGLAVYDSRARTDYAQTIAPTFFERLDEEFTAGDGDPYTLQASRFGMAAKAMRGITNSAPIAAMLGPLDPQRQWRTWQLLVREEINTERYLDTDRPGSSAPTDIDWSGGTTRALALAWTMFLARERGDDATYRKVRHATKNLENPTGPDVVKPFAAGVNANGILGLGMTNSPGAWRSMLLDQPQPTSGPRLTNAPHPTVTVVTAVHDSTGALTTVLYPGRISSNTPQQLGVGDLEPHQRYVAELHGSTSGTRHIVSDRRGEATISVSITGRTHLRLRPAQ